MPRPSEAPRPGGTTRLCLALFAATMVAVIGPANAFEQHALSPGMRAHLQAWVREEAPEFHRHMFDPMRELRSAMAARLDASGNVVNWRSYVDRSTHRVVEESLTACREGMPAGHRCVIVWLNGDWMTGPGGELPKDPKFQRQALAAEWRGRLLSWIKAEPGRVAKGFGTGGTLHSAIAMAHDAAGEPVQKHYGYASMYSAVAAEALAMAECRKHMSDFGRTGLECRTVYLDGWVD